MCSSYDLIFQAVLDQIPTNDVCPCDSTGASSLSTLEQKRGTGTMRSELRSIDYWVKNRESGRRPTEQIMAITAL